MNSFKSFWLFAALALAISHSCLGAAYTITDIGVLDGGDSSIANDINSSGEVVGWGTNVISSGSPSHYARAIFYSSGQVTDLGTLGGPLAYATGINDDGVIVGESMIDSGSQFHAFIYSNGVMQNIDPLSNYSSIAWAVNSSGQAVGEYSVNSGSTSAFLYSGGTLTDLGKLDGASYSAAYGINDLGQAVGSSDFRNAQSEAHATLFSDGQQIDLGVIGGYNSRARAINDAGQVVGTSTIDSSGARHAFLFEDGNMHDLGTLGGEYSEARAINSSGVVVGLSAVTGFYDVSPFIYSAGSMVDLNSLLEPSSGWLLTNATSINDLGQIVGSGTIDGETHGFILTPVPEPRSIVLAGLAVLCLAACGAWRRNGKISK